MIVDDAIDKVIRQLKESGLYENSVILVTTDNGGGPWYSNQPLKGSKETLYEGGIRAASFLLSPLLQKTGYRFEVWLFGVYRQKLLTDYNSVSELQSNLNKIQTTQIRGIDALS